MDLDRVYCSKKVLRHTGPRGLDFCHSADHDSLVAVHTRAGRLPLGHMSTEQRHASLAWASGLVAQRFGTLPTLGLQSPPPPALHPGFLSPTPVPADLPTDGAPTAAHPHVQADEGEGALQVWA